MADAKHTPEGDTSFRASVLKQGGGAVAVVAVSALVFWAIGALGGGPTVPSVTDQETAAPDDQPDETGDDEPGEDETPSAPEPEPDPEPDPEPEVDDEAPEPDDADDADDAEEADEEADDPEAIDPASVTVQVLDGFKTDGGAAAGEVADVLADAGYRIVARNQAIDYAETTVLYNPGHQDAAEQIARELGSAVVREQPGNLSTQVAVHVVVGADRG